MVILRKKEGYRRETSSPFHYPYHFSAFFTAQPLYHFIHPMTLHVHLHQPLRRVWLDGASTHVHLISPPAVLEQV